MIRFAFRTHKGGMETIQREESRGGEAVRERESESASRKSFFKLVGGAGAASAFAVFVAACGDDDDDS